MLLVLVDLDYQQAWQYSLLPLTVTVCPFREGIVAYFRTLFKCSYPTKHSLLMHRTMYVHYISMFATR